MTSWRGSRSHIVITIVLFVLLASLDNAAFFILPNILLSVSEDLGIATGTLGWVTASVILITAATAVAWGYWGDRSNRKRLLIIGTLVWSVGSWLTAQSDSLWQLWTTQAFTAMGLGAIASIGFSTVSDFIAPARRSLAMSFWGLAQGAGGVAGSILASQFGAENWRTPFTQIAALGAIAALAYSIAYEPKRGASEPSVGPGSYDYTIDHSDIPEILRSQSNRWLILQGIFAQLAYGALIWVPLLYQSKVVAEGYDVATATRAGGLFVAIGQIAAISSIGAGYLGDRWHSRNPRGRAYLSMIGVLGAIPFFMAFSFLPLRGLSISDGASSGVLLREILGSLVSNPWVAGAFILSFLALALTGADSPNWLALIADVNLPEHRGTVFGLANLANGVGRSVGNALTGLAAVTLLTVLPPPVNFAVGLASFQLFFLPTGYAYWRVARSVEHDARAVQTTLKNRSLAQD